LLGAVVETDISDGKSAGRLTRSDNHYQAFSPNFAH
jgi:hypothetical protein